MDPTSDDHERIPVRVRRAISDRESPLRLAPLRREDLPPYIPLQLYARFAGLSYDTCKDLARQNRLDAPTIKIKSRTFVKRDALLAQLDGTSGEIARLEAKIDALTAKLDALFGAFASLAAEQPSAQHTTPSAASRHR